MNKITPGSKALIYVAGRNRRQFVGLCEIGGLTQINILTGSNNAERKLNEMFKFSFALSNAVVFKAPIKLDEKLRESISFIKDKKNWGLFFRQATKLIPEMDFELILGNQAEKYNISIGCG